MIATEAEAMRAIAIHRYGVKAHPGWTFIGSGCERVVYLAPSGIVYKIAHICGKANAREITNYWKFLNSGIVGDGFALPEMDYFEGDGHYDVIACEYISGEHPHFHYGWEICPNTGTIECADNDVTHNWLRRGQRRFGLTDLDEYNIKIVDKTCYLIDIEA